MDYNNNAFELEAVEDDPSYVTTVSYQCQICAAHVKAKKSHKHPLKNPKYGKKHEPTGRPVGRPYGT